MIPMPVASNAPSMSLSKATTKIIVIQIEHTIVVFGKAILLCLSDLF